MTIPKSSGFRVVHTGVQPRANNDGLLGGLDGGLGGGLGGGTFPTLSIPGIGGLTSILGLPGPDTSTTSSATTTSVQTTTTSNTISLTASSSTTSSDTLTTASSSPTTSSTTTTSSITTTSSTSTSTSTSNIATATPPSSSTAETSTNTVTQIVGPSTSSSTSSATPSPQADAAPKSFLQNKALSVGVITAASLVGLVLIIALATWAIRKRRHDRLHEDILDFSTANLVGESHDAEKGAGAGAGSADTSSSGHGSSFGHGGSLPPAVQPRQAYQLQDPGAGYGAAAAAYGVPQREPSRAAQPYGAQAAYGGAYGAYQQPNNTYDNWNYGYGAATPPSQHAYDQAYGGMEDPYGGVYGNMQYDNTGMMAGVGAGAQQQAPANPPQRRPSAQRKPAPPLNIPTENPIAQPGNVVSPESAMSLNNPPLQAAASSNSANPPRQRRTSLLDPPATGSAESGSGRAYPNLPPPAPLPDQFGASIGSPTEIEEPRRLIVRNE
ncbi:hypothetical protein DICSQDRAFT_154090 [Dichomitus squalens LYAD-421 SS1]|uniref:uncharacterized protein n=1 Tax=Dichomitus squalens (strain LYAD-421) TaxID=732165 RepID=UPI000441324F|nr:uncharacterized protein DICSQDRAFT_154090 [Dichomitus squalens LYAD-421 SS1]EJF62837.1 hypothetical protein DICSQDRAFT_154090 [Dichomitus squalens LYAD-421 SS1]